MILERGFALGRHKLAIEIQLVQQGPDEFSSVCGHPCSTEVVHYNQIVKCTSWKTIDQWLQPQVQLSEYPVPAIGIPPSTLFV